MRMPERMPARAIASERTLASVVRIDVRNDAERPIVPAACCAEACVNIPFVGRVCHCVLDLPICP